MEKPAVRKCNATRYVVYIPFKNQNEDEQSEIKEKALVFVRKVFGGATVYRAEGTTSKWGEELTYALEIVVEVVQDVQFRIEQLAWLILCYLDNFRMSKGKTLEETICYYEQPITLYKLNNPDLKKEKTPCPKTLVLPTGSR